MTKHIRIWLELGKVRIAVLTTMSALTGYVLAGGAASWEGAAAMAGVFVLACGAGALNQYQEIDIDGRMPRTKGRPLPTGRIGRTYGLVASLVMLAVGLALLIPEPMAALLGVFTVVWYNGIYTNLKRISAFAAIPGGVVGSIPPLIGWVAAGGSVYDPIAVALAFFFFLWQVPHFWLLLLRIGDQYRMAGLPTLTDLFSNRQLTRITYVWMLATGVSALLIPAFGGASSNWVAFGLLTASLWMSWHATAMVRSGGATLAFKEINIYALAVICMLAVGAFIG